MNLNLDDRQRKILLIAGAGIALLLFLLIVVLPRLGFGGLDRRIAAKETELKEMIRLYKSFEQVKRDFNSIESAINRNTNLSLLSELSDIANKLNIQQGIDSMVSKAKPKNDFYEEEAVEMRVKKLTLEEMTRLLYEVEQSPKVLRIKKLHIEGRFDDRSLLDAVLEVSTFKRLES